MNTTAGAERRKAATRTGDSARPGDRTARKPPSRQEVEEDPWQDLDFYDDEESAAGTSALPPRRRQKSVRSKSSAKSDAHVSDSDRESAGKQMLGGIVAMVGAVVWFVVGLTMMNVIFVYPPILFIGGLIAFCKGLMGMR